MVFIMALDPEELVILNDHGPMKLHAAVMRAMMLPPTERDCASIVRNGEPWILDFDLIKHLARRWDEVHIASMTRKSIGGAFSLPRVLF